MKNLLLLGAIALTLTSFTSADVKTELTTTSTSVVAKSFTILNDTKESVSIHTGSGFVTLNKGSKTSVSCNTGKEVSLADSGKKTKTIFKITDDMCGGTVKLSDYL